MKTLFKILGIVFSILIVVASLFIFGTFLPFENNYSLHVVESGSMAPTIPVGAVVATIPRAEYKQNDIVTFYGSRNATPTTHRIIEVERTDGKEYFRTKGDANPEPDLARLSRENISGKVFLTVPYAGYVAYFMQTKLGVALVIGIFLLWLMGPQVYRRLTKVSTSRS